MGANSDMVVQTQTQIQQLWLNANCGSGMQTGSTGVCVHVASDNTLYPHYTTMYIACFN